jgi:hypothetical protein
MRAETGAPEKIHDSRQSVDFSHEFVARIEPTISEVKGTCSDDCAPPKSDKIYQTKAKNTFSKEQATITDHFCLSKQITKHACSFRLHGFTMIYSVDDNL